MLAAALMAASPAPATIAGGSQEAPPPLRHAMAGSVASRLLCRDALARVEGQIGIPAGLLVALGQVESGLWPWSLNIDGRPERFPTREAAERRLAEALRTTRNIDIGCGQVNAYWHAAEVGDARLYLDPDLNAAYAGWHLASLWAGRCSHSWSCAGRRYYGSSSEANQRRRECRWAKAIAILQDRPAPACKDR